MLELAPLPAAPEALPNEAPPGPELSEVIPEPEEPPPLDLKPPPPKPKPIEKKVEKKPPQPRVSAPQAAPEPARTAAAPMPGASVEPPSNTLPTWKGLLLRHLERHKRYPSDAQRSRHEGVTYVRFTMSRDGRILAARIERPSGHAALDQEGLDLLQRAQPLPPLPQDQPGESLEIVVPIQFLLKR
jgi:protein TonB